jgi:hypothetical protein
MSPLQRLRLHLPKLSNSEIYTGTRRNYLNYRLMDWFFGLMEENRTAII